MAEAEVERAKVALETFSLERDRVKALYDSGYISLGQWQETEGNYHLLETELDLAEATLKALETGSRQEDIEIARSQVEVLNRSLESSRRLLGKHEIITAPMSGRVKLSVVVEELLRIERMDTLAVVISIPESSVPMLEKGQSIIVRFQADDVPRRTSRLLRVNYHFPDFTGAYAVGLLGNEKLILQPGMAGSAKLSIGSKTMFSGLKAKFNI